MALTLGASSSNFLRVTAASGINGLGGGGSVGGAGGLTLMFWYRRIGALASGRRIIAKESGSTASGWSLATNNTSGQLRFVRHRATTNMSYNSSSTNILGPTGWVFVAVTCDAALGSGNKVKFYAGSETAAATASAVAVSNEGAGNIDVETDDLDIGWAAGNGLEGDFHAIGMFARVLSLNEIIGWQFDPGVFAACCGFWIAGDRGLVDSTDYSGNQHPAVLTGGTLVAPPSLPLYFGVDDPTFYEVPAGGSTTVTKTVTLRSVIRKSQTKGVTLRSVLRKTLTKAVTLRAQINTPSGSTLTRSVTLRAPIKGVGLTKSVALAAVVGSNFTTHRTFWARTA
jgi:hypothetical protein